MTRAAMLAAIALAAALPLLAAARCTPNEEHAQHPTVAASLPLLGDSRVHLYVQEAYEGFPPDVTQAVAGRHAELVAAGMDSARHLFDWGELEPAPGVYDTQAVITALDARRAAGIDHQFCNITVIDSGGPEALPPEIVDLLEAGVSWDDPRIIGRFAVLLDVVVPLMLDRDVYMLGVANEPGGYYEDDPAGAASFAAFVEAAINRIHAIEPRLAGTVVFAGPQDPSIPALLPLVDVATFNQYAYTLEPEPACQLAGFVLPLARAAPPDAVAGLLDDLIAVADGKLICIQEFGQSTGWNDSAQSLGPDAGLANQRAVMTALADALAARPGQFRTVCIWTLNDHTPEGLDWLADALIAEGLPACYVANLVEAFGPAGLVRSDATASPKPAFEAFKQAVARFAADPPTLRETGPRRALQSAPPERKRPVDRAAPGP